MPRFNFVDNTHWLRRTTRGERRSHEYEGGYGGHQRAHTRMTSERVAPEIRNKLADMTAGELHSCHSSRPFLMTEDLGGKIFGAVRLGIREE